jgi:hypothetical protein
MNSEWFSIPVPPRQLGDEQREAFVLLNPHFGTPRPPVANQGQALALIRQRP